MAAPLVRAARLVNIVGADAADLTGPESTLFRAAPGPAVRMPRLASWLHDDMKARLVSLVWSNTEFGRDGRDILARELRTRGLELASDHAVVPGPAGYSAEVAAVAKAAPDAAVVYLPEVECARFLQEARRQALRTPLVGDTTLAAPRVLALAGGAAEGVRCQLDFTAEAPEVAAFRGRYLESFKEEPDAAAARGYTAVGLMVGGATALGRPDRAALADQLRGLRLQAGASAMMLDASWEATGEMDRVTFMVEVRNGRPSVLRPLSGR